MATTMQGKTVLITGGTSGIGQQTAIALARKGAHVIVTGRDQTRGNTGVEQIKAASGSDLVELMLADFSRQADIHRLADEVIARVPRLDVLINNVGLLEGERRLTVDGIEAHFAVNVVAPFLFTRRLLPLLQASASSRAPSRVINVTGGFPVGKVDLENLQAEKSFLGLITYSHAKRAMQAMSIKMARDLAGSGVTINIAYPGGADTNMTRAMTPQFVPAFLRPLWPLFTRLNFTRPDSAAKAARSSIYLASSPDVANTTGMFFNTESKRSTLKGNMAEPRLQEALWQTLERLTQPGAQPALTQTYAGVQVVQPAPAI